MKLTRNGEGLSFVLQTKKNTVSINNETGDLKVFLSEQKKEQEGLFHWGGEYEKDGVSVFLVPKLGDFFVGRVFVEGVRMVFFCDEGVTEVNDALLESFGNVDVLVFEKGENGLSKSDLKKVLEKVDPRILVACQGSTALALKEYSYPFTESSSLSLAKTSLPSDVSEYIIL